MTTSGATSVGIRTLTDTFSAGVFLQLLDSTSEAKLLADTSITVGDRHQASIRIVRKIPIVGANPVENSNVVFTQTEFEEAGVILNVLPRISRDGTIELQVQPEYSVVAEITSTGPVIDSRTADTTVRVGNGQMFVLGGLRQKSIVESVRGIPYLKDIKHFGKLFRSHDADVRESELIVFLKPEIITPVDFGELRQQRAACIASKQLDAIPYAETRPITPCCKDPYCPNHCPRCRINGGSRQLEMMGGSGLNSYEVYVPQEVEIIDEYVEEPTQATHQEQRVPEVTQRHSPNVMEDVYPPLHIDLRVGTISGSQNVF
jgi:general secretion pathway protein D